MLNLKDLRLNVSFVSVIRSILLLLWLLLFLNGWVSTWKIPGRTVYWKFQGISCYTQFYFLLALSSVVVIAGEEGTLSFPYMGWTRVSWGASCPLASLVWQKERLCCMLPSGAPDKLGLLSNQSFGRISLAGSGAFGVQWSLKRMDCLFEPNFKR